MGKVEEKTELEIAGEQAIKDIQRMINPKWNVPRNGNADGPLYLQLLNVRSLYIMSKMRKELGYDEDPKIPTSEVSYETLCERYKNAYEHFLQDIIYFKAFLETPFGQMDIENYMAGFSDDELRTKNFEAIIHNLLVREDLLALNLDLIDRIYRIHTMANTRGKKTRKRKSKKTQKSDNQ